MPGSTQTIMFIGTMYLMVGQILQGANCAYINIVQDQAGGIYGTNDHNVDTITIQG